MIWFIVMVVQDQDLAHHHLKGLIDEKEKDDQGDLVHEVEKEKEDAGAGKEKEAKLNTN